MTEANVTIPKFDDPPIIEKLMGVQFSPLDEWSVPHFGLFWQTIREDYPTFSVQPPLLQESAQFTLEEIPIRCWFFHKSETKLIQVQRDRFLYNWQKPTTYEKYPYYEGIKPEFEQIWLKFLDFLSANQIDTPILEQCEITYINHFERGKEWQNLSDLPDVLKCWSNISDSLILSEPDLISFQIGYSLPEVNGKLAIQLQPAFRQEDSKEIFQLRITVIGQPTSQSLQDVMTWFDAGRNCTVKSFVDLTTEKMHKLWKKRD